MRKFSIAYHTDIGIKRQSNQDSLLIRGLEVGASEIVLVVLCDGMGGMEKGELASATVVRAFGQWFQDVYASTGAGWNVSEITRQWNTLFVQCNRKLQEYGQKESAQLGTTATVMLLHSSGQYIIGHVGDTRIYKISAGLQMLTEDHTLMAREIQRGNLTEEQAKMDPRKNVLLQCIGVNDYLEPQFAEGILEKDAAVLLCSDGFRHELSGQEILQTLAPGRFQSDVEIKKALVHLVELNKQRRETDNITAIYVKRVQ